MTPMDEIDKLLIERACERLIIASADHNDRREWAALAGLYTDDGVVVRPSGERVEGRSAIEAAYRSGPSERVTRHLCTNIEVMVDGPADAHARTAVLIVAGVRADGSDIPTGVVPNDHHPVGEFADRFRLTDEGWKIVERRATVQMTT